MPNEKDGLNSPELKRIKDQTNYFNRKRADYNNTGKGKPLPVGFKVGNQVVDSVSPDKSKYFWSNADSSQVSEEQRGNFPSDMAARGFTGYHELRDREVPPPPIKMPDSVFAKLTPQSVVNMPQTRLRGNVVCSEKGGCSVNDSFDMSGKSINSKGHTGKEMVDVNKAHFTTYPPQGPNRMVAPTKEGAERAWNAGEEITNQLNNMAIKGDTAQVRKILQNMQGFKANGDLFKTEMRQDTIPEQAQYISQQEMEEMRNQGLDVSSYKGYANKDEAKKTAMYNPVRKKAFSEFEQKLKNVINKKP